MDLSKNNTECKSVVWLENIDFTCIFWKRGIFFIFSFKEPSKLVFSYLSMFFTETTTMYSNEARCTSIIVTLFFLKNAVAHAMFTQSTNTSCTFIKQALFIMSCFWLQWFIKQNQARTVNLGKSTFFMLFRTKSSLHTDDSLIKTRRIESIKY